MYSKADEINHSSDIENIITAVPSSILRWGISIIFIFFAIIICMASFINYPDIIKTQMRVESQNAAKPIVAKISGKLVKLLIHENDFVSTGESLAYLESTANHVAVLDLLMRVQNIQEQISNEKSLNKLDLHFDIGNLGELQSSYQIFYQEYLIYKSSINDGFYLKKKEYLNKELVSLSKQRDQLIIGKTIQQQDMTLAEEEFNMHKTLENKKIETPAELRQEESKYLSKKAPLVQTETTLSILNGSYSQKQAEILELDNQIIEEKAKFIQALNSFISQIDEWKSKYVLTASQSGKISFAQLLQENQIVNANQEVFYIDPSNEQYFGEMQIPQNNMGKVEENQTVLIKLRSYPFEQFGIIHGKITYIADVPYRDSVFIAKVKFKLIESSSLNKTIHLKQGMIADAEIVAENATLLQRITRNFVKLINN